MITPIALYYRVDEPGSTPVHVQVLVYVGEVDGTKALIGTLTLRREEFNRLFRPTSRLLPIPGDPVSLPAVGR